MKVTTVKTKKAAKPVTAPAKRSTGKKKQLVF
jgi:hypothetical protein